MRARQDGYRPIKRGQVAIMSQGPDTGLAADADTVRDETTVADSFVGSVLGLST